MLIPITGMDVGQRLIRPLHAFNAGAKGVFSLIALGLSSDALSQSIGPVILLVLIIGLATLTFRIRCAVGFLVC
jgi:hypothetical protein